MENITADSVAVNRWRKQIAARMVPHVKAGVAPAEAVKLAIQEYSDFLVEMWEQKTERSRRAVRVIQASVFAQVQINEAINRPI